MRSFNFVFSYLKLLEIRSKFIRKSPQIMYNGQDWCMLTTMTMIFFFFCRLRIVVSYQRHNNYHHSTQSIINCIIFFLVCSTCDYFKLLILCKLFKPRKYDLIIFRTCRQNYRIGFNFHVIWLVIHRFNGYMLYIRLRICCSRHTLRLNNKLHYTHPSVAKFALPVLNLPEGDRFSFDFPTIVRLERRCVLVVFFFQKNFDKTDVYVQRRISGSSGRYLFCHQRSPDHDSPCRVEFSRSSFTWPIGEEYQSRRAQIVHSLSKHSIVLNDDNDNYY